MPRLHSPLHRVFVPALAPRQARAVTRPERCGPGFFLGRGVQCPAQALAVPLGGFQGPLSKLGFPEEPEQRAALRAQPRRFQQSPGARGRCAFLWDERFEVPFP